MTSLTKQIIKELVIVSKLRPAMIPILAELLQSIVEDRQPKLPPNADWRLWQEVYQIWREVAQ